MVPLGSSVMLELVLAVHSYHVIAYLVVRLFATAAYVSDKTAFLLLPPPLSLCRNISESIKIKTGGGGGGGVVRGWDGAIGSSIDVGILI